MSKRDKERGTKASAVALVRVGGKAEKRLLRREHKAEAALKSAIVRLKKAQTRLERRLAAVADAEALLRSRQSARAVGPDGAAEASAGESLVHLSPSDPGENGTSPEIVIDATAPAAPKRPSRRKAATRKVPESPPAEIVLPAAKKPAPRRRSRSTAAKTQEGTP